jgi:hypothetical protein
MKITAPYWYMVINEKLFLKYTRILGSEAPLRLSLLGVRNTNLCSLNV